MLQILVQTIIKYGFNFFWGRKIEPLFPPPPIIKFVNGAPGNYIYIYFKIMILFVVNICES